MEVAADHGARTVAFPSISTGVYGYPKYLAAQTALDTVSAALAHLDLDEVRFVVFSDDDRTVYQRAMRGRAAGMTADSNGGAERQGMRRQWETWYQDGDAPWEDGQPWRPLPDLLSHYAPPGGRVLDIGCGMGGKAAQMASLGYRVLGIDIAAPAVAAARRASHACGRRIRGAPGRLPEENRLRQHSTWHSTEVLGATSTSRDGADSPSA